MLEANQFITPVPVYKMKYWNDNTQSPVHQIQ